MDKKTLLFTLNDESLIDIDDDPSSQFATAKILAFSSGKNEHDYYCSEETLRKTAHTLNHRPILYSYDNRFRDFGTHVKDDREKNLIAGFVVPNSYEFVDLKDGRLGIYVLARIWKLYSPKFVKLFKEKNQRNVSVEMELFESSNMKNGLTEMVSFAYSGVTVLGEFYTPASPGAEMEFLSFSKENEEIKKAYILEFGKYEGLDFTIPKKVKENAKQGLELRKEYGRGGTSVGLSSARYLISNQKASPEKVRHVAKYFPRHEGDNLDDKTSNGWIAWQLWGGHAGRSWSTKLVKQMNDRDAENMSFFAIPEEEENMPYKNIDDVNPAIRGITPPVSLDQANSIARQADAIGIDDEKNGWAIAISNFKKSHEVDDGKWVKKSKEEKNSMEKGEKVEQEEMAVEESPSAEKSAEPKKEEFAENESENEDKENGEESNEEQETEEETETEDMSLDAYADVPAMLALLEAETDDYKSMAETFANEKKIDWAVMAKALYAKFAKEKEDATEKEKAYMAENEQLREFKFQKEKEQFDFAVAEIIAKVEKDLPKDKLKEVKEDVVNFSLETFEDFKNKTLALAFEYKSKEVEDPEKSKKKIVSYPFPEVRSQKVASPWGK